MTKRPITPEDLWSIRRIGQPEPLAEGDAAVLPITDFDDDHDQGVTSLHLLSADGSLRPLTTGDHNDTQPAVSPDGNAVAFIRKADGDDHGQPHVMPLHGGESRRLAEFPLGALDPRWSPDGSAVYVLAKVLADHPWLEDTADAVAARREDPVQAHATEDRIYRYWDRWLTDGAVHHIFRIDLATGEVRDLIPESVAWWHLLDPLGTWDVAPDGSEIAYSANIAEPPFDVLQFAIHTVPAGGGRPIRLSAELPAHQWRPRYSPDGDRIVFGIQLEADFYADRVRLVSHGRATGREEVLTEAWDRSASGWEFLGNDRLVLAAEDDARQHLFTMPVAVAEPAVMVEGGFVHGPQPAGGFLWYRHESLAHPAQVHRRDLEADVSARIDRVNDDLLEGLDLGEVSEVRFPGADGEEVQSFVVHPPGFDPEENWPLIHSIHGGPHGISGDQWHYRWNPHVFAAPGYVVALVNFHGSTSWGQEFARCIHGAWGDKPSTDVLAATDHLVAQGYVDPSRMAIAGGSYGGYLVAWLLGLTDRFAAAVCHAGVTNLVGQYASDVTQGRERALGADVWTDPDQVLRWSPTVHLADAVTPTLVIHGEKDYRVVLTQGLELYGILQAKGVPARLLYYPDENHWILKRANSLRWYEEFAGWLERFLGA